MEKWVQLLMVTVSLLKLLLEIPETLYRWKKKYRHKGRRQGRKPR